MGIYDLLLMMHSNYGPILYLHCQAAPSMFCRGRYKNTIDWLVGWLGFNGTFSTNRPYRAM